MINTITIIGNTGSEVEMRFTPNGKPVANFTVATNRTYTANGEKQKETTWFTIVAWDKLAEICNQYVSKGMLVYVSGRVSLHEWEGQDGKTRARMEITADKVQMLDRATATKDTEDDDGGF